MIRAVIFDMGNTLLHYERPGTGSWRDFEARGIRSLYRYLIDAGHSPTTNEDGFVAAMFQRLADGWQQAIAEQINLRATEWIAAGAAAHAITLNADSLLAATYAYAQPLRQQISAVPGAAQSLAELRQRGVRIGLISNTIWPGQFHLEDLELFGLRECLESITFSGDAGIWKPHPAIFLGALEQLQVEPHNAVFVGDNPYEDIQGAKQVGMFTIWVRNSEFPLNAIQPDAIISDQTELLPILAQLGY
jgi:putative hydrolase of the HAD superfamily